MKNKKSKKNKKKFIQKNNEIGQTKNSAKLVLFIFGIGPIIGIIIFLYIKGFFNSPNIQLKKINLKIINNCNYPIENKLLKFF